MCQAAATGRRDQAYELNLSIHDDAYACPAPSSLANSRIRTPGSATARSTPGNNLSLSTPLRIPNSAGDTARVPHSPSDAAFARRPLGSSPATLPMHSRHASEDGEREAQVILSNTFGAIKVIVDHICITCQDMGRKSESQILSVSFGASSCCCSEEEGRSRAGVPRI